MHREGTQILGTTTLQLLLLTVTLRWTSLQFLRLDTLPSLKFNMANLTTYFITRLVSDQRAAKDFKNLNKKAVYPLFKDGHVQEIKTCIHQQHYYITAIRIPEMKKTLQYHIKLILEKAECGCPAGLGPSGTELQTHRCSGICTGRVCTYIACIRNQVACTSQLQTWNQPRKRVLEPSEVSSIKFVKLEHEKEKRPITCKFYDPKAATLGCAGNLVGHPHCA